MNSNLFVAIYRSEDDAVSAFHKLKDDNEGFELLQMAVMVKEEDDIRYLTTYDSGSNTSNDTIRDTLIGTLCGALAGPLGLLVGAGLGFMTGAAKDMIDAAKSEDIFKIMITKLNNGEVALVAVVDENDESILDKRLTGKELTSMRWDIARIEEQIEKFSDFEDRLVRKVNDHLSK